eukprot:scaffold6161_cov376-Prasinococcus_capsulatus_cf.AAC.2
MTGVNALITAVLKRTRGEKDDPWNTVRGCSMCAGPQRGGGGGARWHRLGSPPFPPALRR